MSSERAKVHDAGSLHTYRTEIPNIVWELGLTPYELALYAALKRTAGDGGKCFKATKTLAEEASMSPAMVVKTKAALATARPELNGKPLIQIEEQESGRAGRARHDITIVDIWPENFAYFAPDPNPSQTSPCELQSSPHDFQSSHGDVQSSPHDFQSSHGDVQSSPHEHEVHVVARKKEPIKKEPIKKEPEEEECSSAGADAPTPEPADEDLEADENFDAVFGKGTSSFDPPADGVKAKPLDWDKPLCEMKPHQAMTAAVLDAIGWDRKTLTMRDRAQVAQVCRILREAGYEYADVGEFMTRIWFRDWRWTEKESRPTLSQLRQEIGKIRAGIPVEMPAGASKSDQEIDAVVAMFKANGGQYGQYR